MQGFNLCLISRCTTGSDAADGAGTGADDPVTEGIRQTQGGNICILSTCTVQP